MLPKKEIIDRIAAKHKIRLDDDDPILVTLSLNEAILDEAANQLAAQMNEQHGKLTASHQGHIKEFKQQGEMLVNKAADYLSETLLERCDSKLQSMHALLERTETLYKRIILLAIVSACLIGTAMIVTLLGVL